MSKKYSNPPIVEAVCEFRFSKDTPWDMVVPGLLYEKIRSEFPIREPKMIQDININLNNNKIEPVLNPHERIIFKNIDKNILVQVDNNLLAINHLKPYPTWTKFQPLIISTFKKLSGVVVFKQIQRIGLRYINRIEIPEPQIELEKYFKFKPDLGDKLPQDVGNFMLHCELPHKAINADCDIKFTNAIPAVNNKSAFILDIDFYLTKPLTAAIDDITKWIESAHTNVENIFEGCITDNLRKEFMESQ